jgi:hypothetical protein
MGNASQSSMGKLPINKNFKNLKIDKIKKKNLKINKHSKGFHDHFIDMYDQFSKSWRDQIDQEMRKRPGMNQRGAQAVPDDHEKTDQFNKYQEHLDLDFDKEA